MHEYYYDLILQRVSNKVVLHFKWALFVNLENCQNQRPITNITQYKLHTPFFPCSLGSQKVFHHTIDGTNSLSTT